MNLADCYGLEYYYPIPKVKLASCGLWTGVLLGEALWMFDQFGFVNPPLTAGNKQHIFSHLDDPEGIRVSHQQTRHPASGRFAPWVCASWYCSRKCRSLTA